MYSLSHTRSSVTAPDAVHGVLQGQQAVAFERFMAFRKSGGNHCHINVVPVPASAADTARATFDRAAAAIGAEFKELPRSSGEVQPETLHLRFQGFLQATVQRFAIKTRSLIRKGHQQPRRIPALAATRLAQ